MEVVPMAWKSQEGRTKEQAIDIYVGIIWRNGPIDIYVGREGKREGDCKERARRVSKGKGRCW